MNKKRPKRHLTNNIYKTHSTEATQSLHSYKIRYPDNNKKYIEELCPKILRMIKLLNNSIKAVRTIE